MKKLNQEQRKLVEECREAVKQLSIQQEALYDKLCEEVDYESDWLFDYIFNSMLVDSHYEVLVREHLFE